MNLLVHEATQQALEAFASHPAHAVLLTGEVGVGKTLIARQLAERLLGSNSLENHAYFKEIALIKGVIVIDQIRELNKFFTLSVPGDNPVKRVALIPDADIMGQEAQNALLKLLEEPPVGSVLLLTTSRPTGLLPTIRSRVQTLHITSPQKSEITDYFVKAGCPEATVEKAVMRYGSNLANIATALDGASTDTSLELVKRVLSNGSYERMLLVENLAKQKDQVLTFTETLADVAAASLESAASKGSDIRRWQNILESAHTAQDALQRNGSAKLVLTELMLSL